jgi:6-pyruvoyltetrahydropterin/6-carboxytetrahydropterin synthase
MPLVRAGRRYRFSASHRLHTPLLSAEENRAIYGKCNNPYGHGHDFVMDVVFCGELRQPEGRLLPLAALDAFVREVVLRHFDHVDLNTQIEEFAGLPSTSENLARVLIARLESAWPQWFSSGAVKLEKVRIWETARNIFEESAGAGQLQAGSRSLVNTETKS